jgi:hypothetical protein
MKLIKTNRLAHGIFCLLIVLFSGCQKDNPQPNENKANARLKQIQLFAYKDSKVPIGIVEEYEYDDRGRISRTSSPMYEDGIVTGTFKYNLYEYNPMGQLLKISNFNANRNSPTGFINLTNHIYSYSADGKKIKETIEDPNGSVIEYSLYEYEDNRPVIIKKYSHDNLESYIENQYDTEGRLVKELYYTGDGKCISYTINNYIWILQVSSDIYLFENNTHYRSVKRTYDEYNNLITLESEELSLFSSMLSFVFRYIYFDKD